MRNILLTILSAVLFGWPVVGILGELRKGGNDS